MSRFGKTHKLVITLNLTQGIFRSETSENPEELKENDAGSLASPIAFERNFVEPKCFPRATSLERSDRRIFTNQAIQSTFFSAPKRTPRHKAVKSESEMNKRPFTKFETVANTVKRLEEMVSCKPSSDYSLLNHSTLVRAKANPYVRRQRSPSFYKYPEITRQLGANTPKFECLRRSTPPGYKLRVTARSLLEGS